MAANFSGLHNLRFWQATNISLVTHFSRDLFGVSFRRFATWIGSFASERGDMLRTIVSILASKRFGWRQQLLILIAFSYFKLEDNNFELTNGRRSLGVQAFELLTQLNIDNWITDSGRNVRAVLTILMARVLGSDHCGCCSKNFS